MSKTAENTHLGVQGLRVQGYLVNREWLLSYARGNNLVSAHTEQDHHVQICLSAVRHIRLAAKIRNLSLQYVWDYVDRPGCSAWIESKMCLALANDSEEEEGLAPKKAEIKRLKALLMKRKSPRWYPWAG